MSFRALLLLLPLLACVNPPVGGTGECVGPEHTPGGPDGRGGCWPGPHNTGVPEGVTLTPYTGPCTITTAGLVLDAKSIECALSIQAAGVVIRRSRIIGSIWSEAGQGSFTLEDSEVQAPRSGAAGSTGIGEADFKVVRVEVTGGNRSILCGRNCEVRDSWVHGQDIDPEPRIHASGIRQSQGGLLVHNAILCDVEDTPSGGGCSANLTGYGDFEPVKNNRIERNLFLATPGGACAYGGSSGADGSKPFGDQAEGVVFVENVFQRGETGNCGYWFAVADFDPSRPGNAWTDNRWDDGAVVDP